MSRPRKQDIQEREENEMMIQKHGKDEKQTRAYRLLKARGYENIDQDTLNRICTGIAMLANLEFCRTFKRRKKMAYFWLEEHFEIFKTFLPNIALKTRDGEYVGQHDFNVEDFQDHILTPSSFQKDSKT